MGAPWGLNHQKCGIHHQKCGNHHQDSGFSQFRQHMFGFSHQKWNSNTINLWCYMGSSETFTKENGKLIRIRSATLNYDVPWVGPLGKLSRKPDSLSSWNCSPDFWEWWEDASIQHGWSIRIPWFHWSKFEHTKAWREMDDQWEKLANNSEHIMNGLHLQFQDS